MRSKLTPSVKRVLLAGIGAGLFIEEACEHAGIHPATYYRWMEQVRDGKGSAEHRELCEAVRAKEIESEKRALATILKCGTGYESVKTKTRTEPKPGGKDGEEITITEVTTETVIDWRAAQVYLERRFPQRWGRKVEVRNLPGGGKGEKGNKVLLIDVGREP